MEIRHAKPADLPALRELYARARAFMAETGNPTQWGDSRPNMALVEEDIRLGRSYICEENGELLAAFMFTTDPEPTYSSIEGQWPDGGEYGVVHRIATGGARKGAGEYCLRWCRQRCRQLRIDTHADNIPMRNLLGKLGFRCSGVIYVDDGTPRQAFWLA